MRRIRIEHEITDTANLAQIIDVETGDQLSDVFSLDLNLTAGKADVRGVLTRYVFDSKGWVASDKVTNEPMTETEDVIILYVDRFDQSEVAILE